MSSVFWMFVLASLVHVGEEYFFPGGFLESVRQLNPRYAAAFTVPFAVILNSAFVLLVIAGALVGERSLVFSLSIAGLLFINGFAHLAGTIITSHYQPGVISGLLLYLPLSVTAVFLYFTAGRIEISDLVFAGLLGLLYQLTPLILIIRTNRRSA
jgi:hypothetical protein